MFLKQFLLLSSFLQPAIHQSIHLVLLIFLPTGAHYNPTQFEEKVLVPLWCLTGAAAS